MAADLTQVCGDVMAQADVILAGASVRSFAQSAIRDGLRIICVDFFGDADLRRLVAGRNELGFVRTVTRWSDLPEVLADLPPEIPLLPLGGLENQFDVLEEIARGRRLLSVPVDTLRKLRCPDQLFSILVQHKAAVPAWESGSHHDIGSPGNPWLEKKTLSSGGTGVRRAEHGPRNESDDCYRQQFIDGLLMSATFCHGPTESGDGVELLGCALQLAGNPELNASEFQFCGNAGPVAAGSHLRSELMRIGRTLVSEFSLRGVFGVDFILFGHRAWVIEVNPRLTASHELYELHRPEQPGHVSRQLAAFLPDHGFRWSSVRHPGAVRLSSIRSILYADRDVPVDAELSDRLLECADFCCSKPMASGCRLADIPSAGVTVLRNTPFCSLMICGAERGLWRTDLHGILNRIPVETGRITRQFIGQIQAKMQIPDPG
ncbi:MAG: ATP-grasp domain-containing protein [Planctomycetaceae bacterium]